MKIAFNFQHCDESIRKKYDEHLAHFTISYGSVEYLVLCIDLDCLKRNKLLYSFILVQNQLWNQHGTVLKIEVTGLPVTSYHVMCHIQNWQQGPWQASCWPDCRACGSRNDLKRETILDSSINFHCVWLLLQLLQSDFHHCFSI